MTGARPIVIGYDWAPDDGQGMVRDMRVRWALAEVGQPYDEQRLSWGEQKSPEHRARNPFGQVPAFEDDGVTLFESGAIVLHIADRWPGLFPADAAGRARAIEWMFAALNTIEPPITELVIARFVEGGEDYAARRQALITERLTERLRELSARLGDADWLDGQFSAGDLLMVHVLRNLKGGGVLDGFPALARYVARGEARPAFGHALAALRAGLTGEPPAWWNNAKGEKK